MTFVTRLTLESGDRTALDGAVQDIKESAERKGAQLKGPHSHPPRDCRVPQHRRLHADDDREFPAWDYTVFSREVAIHGYEEFARDVAGRDYPDSIHIEAKVEQIHNVGSGRT